MAKKNLTINGTKYSGIEKIYVKNADTNDMTCYICDDDATAIASDVIKDKTAYVNGSKIMGSLVLDTKQDITITPSTQIQNINASDGIVYDKITVSAVNPADYQKNEETITIIPSISEQIISPSDNKVFSEIKVEAVTSSIDNNIQPSNIREGVEILGVTGSMNGQSSTVTFPISLSIDVFGGIYMDRILKVYEGINDTSTPLLTKEYSGSLDQTAIVSVSNEYVTVVGFTSENTDWNLDAYGATMRDIEHLGVIQDVDVFKITGASPYIYADLGCFVKGTLVTMADGSTKKVEDLSYDDYVLAYDFDNGKMSSGKIFWIAREQTAPCYWEIETESGVLLKLVGAQNKSHRLFNATQNKFIYPQDFTEGDEVYFETGKKEKLVRCEKVYKEVEFYNFQADHLNCFVNGVMAGCRFSNVYHIENMKYIKDDRELANREDFTEIPDYLYYGLRLAEQPNNNDGVQYYATTKEHVLHNYMEHEVTWTGERDYKKWTFKDK